VAYNKYFATTPMSGCNFQQSYPQSLTTVPPTPPVPSQFGQLGIDPGIVVQGNKNTRWMYVQMAGAAPNTVPGTAININASTFQAGVGTGGISGTPIVVAVANAGLWCEISGATLSPTSLTNEPRQAAGENDQAYKERVRLAHLQVGENPDGTPLKASTPPPDQHRGGKELDPRSKSEREHSKARELEQA
jgi:hypothetical protein